MSDWMREMVRFSRPKIWMWILNAVLSALVTYIIFLNMGNTGISNQLLIKYPTLFFCVLLIYLSCVLGIWIVEAIAMLCYHLYYGMKRFEKSIPQVGNSTSSIVRLTGRNPSSRKFLKAYQQLLLDIYATGNSNSEEALLPEYPELPDYLPFSVDILDLLGFNAILEDEHFSTEYSTKSMHENLLAKLHQGLNTNFWEQYFDKQSDLQIVSLFSGNPHFAGDTLPKIRKLSNDLEFILRMASYLVVDWCIDVYSRVYGVNKGIFYQSENSSEHEKTVYRLNQFKGNLLENIDIGDIIIYEFSPETKTLQASGGELYQIYRECCNVLK